MTDGENGGFGDALHSKDRGINYVTPELEQKNFRINTNSLDARA